MTQEESRAYCNGWEDGVKHMRRNFSSQLSAWVRLRKLVRAGLRVERGGGPLSIYGHINRHMLDSMRRAKRSQS